MLDIPNDKLMHCLGGALIFDAFFPLIGLIALIPVFIIAWGKEIYDRQHPDKHTADVWDAVATMSGGLIVALPIISNVLVSYL